MPISRQVSTFNAIAVARQYYQYRTMEIVLYMYYKDDLQNSTGWIFFLSSRKDISSSRNFCSIPDYIDGMVMYEYIAILCNFTGIMTTASHPI